MRPSKRTSTTSSCSSCLCSPARTSRRAFRRTWRSGRLSSRGAKQGAPRRPGGTGRKRDMSLRAEPLPMLEYHPVTPERWPDLERLFGKHGADSGCWCMWWRLTRAQFAEQAGEKNKLALKGIVDSGEVPGLLAYADGEPVGWCSLEPREAYPSLERSRTLRRGGVQPGW